MDGDRAPLGDWRRLPTGTTASSSSTRRMPPAFRPGRPRACRALEGRDNILALHTCGKALGVSGALVCRPATLCDYLVNRCRPFIYSTAPSPLMAAGGARGACACCRRAGASRAAGALIALCGPNSCARSAAASAPSGSQILPVMIGDNGRAMAVAAALQARGFDIAASVRRPCRKARRGCAFP